MKWFHIVSFIHAHNNRVSASLLILGRLLFSVPLNHLLKIPGLHPAELRQQCLQQSAIYLELAGLDSLFWVDIRAAVTCDGLLFDPCFFPFAARTPYHDSPEGMVKNTWTRAVIIWNTILSVLWKWMAKPSPFEVFQVSSIKLFREVSMSVSYLVYGYMLYKVRGSCLHRFTVTQHIFSSSVEVNSMPWFFLNAVKQTMDSILMYLIHGCICAFEHSSIQVYLDISDVTSKLDAPY